MRRDFESKLTQWKNSRKRKPLIVRGARQVGKTYSLKKFGKENFTNYHYVNFEERKDLAKIFAVNLSPQNIIDRLSIALDRSIDFKDDLIIFDEVQSVPEAITSLKYFHEEMPELAVVAAGSLLGLQLNELSFPVGKVDSLYMFPMSFFEFLQANHDERLLKHLFQSLRKEEIPETSHAKLWEKLKIYFITGGLPGIVDDYIKDSSSDLRTRLNKVRDQQKQLISTYLDDMAKHCGKENSMHIERLWRDIPNQLASELDGSAPRFKFKGVIPGVSAYSRLSGVIDWLEATGLVIKVKIVHQIQKPLAASAQENRFKLFCFDIGILGAIANLKIQDIMDYDYGTYKGYFAENFVAQELMAGSSSWKNELYCWSEGKAEIEFIRDTDAGIIPIEVKSGYITQSKSLKSFQDRYQPAYGVILSAKNYHTDEAKRLRYYPLYLAQSLDFHVIKYAKIK
jgi:predicted AAA+ superfamily ATPase